MEEKYEITDAELEIMQVLWKNKECNLAEIIEKLSINEEKNKNTIKTLIHRLTIKGAIESKKINKSIIFNSNFNFCLIAFVRKLALNQQIAAHCRFSCRGNDRNGEKIPQFPHEIGIFLGYPLWDVRGFLENEGKNFAYLGYWKVYRDVQNAKLLFQRFDAIREQALEELGRGMTLREIAV